MHVTVTSVVPLWFGEGDPVRAASGIARFGEGWLIAQDDATHGAWWRPDLERVERLRLLPAREGLDLFDERSGTKHLKPDLEAACEVVVDGSFAVLLLGSGSLRHRTCAVLVTDGAHCPQVLARDLGPLYDRVAAVLDLPAEHRNLEGACVLGDRLRWFQRGHGGLGIPSASVDVPLGELLAVFRDGRDPATVAARAPRHYALPTLGGIRLAVTDVVALPDGRPCVSVTAEDAPDAVADGAVTGSALALLTEPSTVLTLPDEVAHHKLEGLAVTGSERDRTRLLAVVDADDPGSPSLAIELTLHLDDDPPAATSS